MSDFWHAKANNKFVECSCDPFIALNFEIKLSFKNDLMLPKLMPLEV